MNAAVANLMRKTAVVRSGVSAAVAETRADGRRATQAANDRYIFPSADVHWWPRRRDALTLGSVRKIIQFRPADGAPLWSGKISPETRYHVTATASGSRLN